MLPPKGLNESILNSIEKKIKKASELISPAYPYEIDFIRTNHLGENILIFPIYWSVKNPHYAPENIDEKNSNFYKYSIYFGKSAEVQTKDGIDKQNDSG